MRTPRRYPAPLAFVVTAGPTREFIDPVRFLPNPSTGRMGFEVARAAASRGHRVALVAGPVALKTPKGVARVDVVSARDMLAAVLARLDALGRGPARVVFVATAAVADWRPAECAAVKLKKGAMRPVLKLVRNPDILKTIAERRAAEGAAPILVDGGHQNGERLRTAGCPVVPSLLAAVRHVLDASTSG